MRRMLGVLAAILLLSGCAEVLDTDYGATRPGSVDGASVLLARLAATTRLRQVHLLSPRLETECDVIVHLMPDPGLPSAEACAWLTQWLRQGTGRQAVLILRGPSPAPLLCRRWADEATAEAERVGGPAGEALRLLAERFARTAERTATPPWPAGDTACALFNIQPGPELRPRRLRLGSNLLAVPQTMRLAATPAGGQTLVEADGRPWAAAYAVGDGRLIVVANAAPLLDGAMPDPAARALAEALRAELADWAGAEAAWAWVGSLRVREGEPAAANPMAMIFTGWPLALATWHLLALVLLWLAARAWRLARRAAPTEQAAASFGDHVDALADQLAAAREHQACTRAVARAHGLPLPPHLASPEAARDWLARSAATTEEHR